MIIIEHSEYCSTVTLNRPAVHHALDRNMIEALDMALKEAKARSSTRVFILQANGRNFCAGADLRWMAEAGAQDPEDNYRDALFFATFLEHVAHFPKPTIALVQGHVVGGGCGLMACCDIVVGTDTADFCFPEVSIGLIPATIAPYVIQRIGYQHMRRYGMTAERMDSQTAQAIGLIDERVDAADLSSRGIAIATQIARNGPEALEQFKKLLYTLQPIAKHIPEETARFLAERRASTEASKRIGAILHRK